MSTHSPTRGTPAAEAARRRTFAIISHPDAGKTTLTEQLLLLGGAIRLAGAVKARGEARRARSDWMRIEQERGISVTTAVMVIDAAKGIESQTRKLFEVCRLRDIPIITFINKMDREARDPFELVDEIADQLQLECAAMNWPAGSGLNFRGVFDLEADDFVRFATGEPRTKDLSALAKDERDKLREEVELVRHASSPFDLETYRSGHMTPVFFGAALKNFGVRGLLQALGRLAPPPRAQAAQSRSVQPEENQVSGFVFKVQANMDPNHRDRVAFLRLCSGKFQRGMRLKQSGTGKSIGVHNPILFFAQEREVVDEAWPGDIIGIPNHGVLRVGDTLSESEDLVFTGIPNFAPEILRRVRLFDAMKAKHLKRALESLAEEGVTQVFKPLLGAQWTVGVVGQLQLDVLKSRLRDEYGLDVDLEASPYETARWVAGTPDEVAKFRDANRGQMAEDRDGGAVFLAKSAWELGYVGGKFPEIRFLKTRERSHAAEAA
jgi:peptide chain release factor 3